MGGAEGRRLNNLFLNLFIIISIATIAKSDNAGCVYTLSVKTGNIIGAGTDSKISAIVYDIYGYGVVIHDLVEWGGSPNHDYFERGNLDEFTGIRPCLPYPVCKLILTSDLSGSHADWNCLSVNVATTTNGSPTNVNFEVNAWLSDTLGSSPSVTIDNCKSIEVDGFDPKIVTVV